MADNPNDDSKQEDYENSEFGSETSQDKHEEYEFTDLDPFHSEFSEEMQQEADQQKTQFSAPQKNTMKRNALIVLGLVLLSMLGYKFLGSFFSKPTQPSDANLAAVAPPQPQQIVPTSPPAPSSIPETPPPTEMPLPEVTQLNQQLSTLQQSQQTVISDVNAMNQQITTLNASINNLNGKIETLMQTLENVSSKLEGQAQQLTILATQASKPKPIPKPVVRRPSTPKVVFYIQAVIPGRAWLVGSNGTTMTVREGTNVPGYGIVRLIDPNQGRVVLSSGKVIKFSSQDS